MFTAEYKAEAVRLAKAGSGNIAATARELGIDVTTLRDWLRRDSAPESDTPSLSPSGKQELLQLSRDVTKESRGFAFIDAEKAHYPVTVVLCRVMEVKRSGFTHGSVVDRVCEHVTTAFCLRTFGLRFRESQNVWEPSRPRRAGQLGSPYQ